MRFTLPLLLCLLLPMQLLPQTLSEERAEAFVQALIHDSDDLKTFVLPEELALSKRLGIEYEGVKHKFMISYEIDPGILESFRDGSTDYRLNMEHSGDSVTKLTVEVPSYDYERRYLFADGYLASPIYFHSAKWNRIESEHFVFLVSDPARFNHYCVDNMERFFTDITEELEFNDDLLQRIRDNKIYYVLCRDEDEVEMLTGYHSRGLCILSHDYVVSAYNCHYHEMMHMLINIRLGKLPLRTHPFLQEGFAVAFGGRGGKEPGPILGLGAYLHQSGMLDYRSLLAFDGFYELDASFTYPLSGLYTQFLLDQLGVDKYLDLYLKYSGTAEEVEKSTISPDDLPSHDKWESFVTSYLPRNRVVIDYSHGELELVHNDTSARVLADETHYIFHLKDTLLIPGDSHDIGYVSSKFNDMCKGREYSGERYLIIADDAEVNVYDLYTNNLIANYVSSFTTSLEPVPQVDSLFEFAISREEFDQPLYSAP